MDRVIGCQIIFMIRLGCEGLSIVNLGEIR